MKPQKTLQIRLELEVLVNNDINHVQVMLSTDSAPLNLCVQTNRCQWQGVYTQKITVASDLSYLGYFIWCDITESTSKTSTFLKEMHQNLGQQQKINYCDKLKTIFTSFHFFVFILKHEGALYKEVFPGKIKAHLSVTVDVRGTITRVVP